VDRDRQRFTRRAAVVAGLLLGGLGLVAARSAQLQVVQHGLLAKLAEDEYLNEVRLPARRGNIYDRHGKPLAVSVDVPSVYANPMAVQDPRGAATQLARLLSVSKETLYQRLASERMFVWVERQVSPDVAEKVVALGLAGVGITKESRRFYPNKETGAHVVGFAGLDAKGLEGIERALDNELAGEPQVVEALRDARGKPVLAAGLADDERTAGADVTLTLDLQIQHAAEAALAAAVKEHQAKGGTAIVLDVATAELLAVAVEPSFNPNAASEFGPERRRNRALTDVFEPASTMKPLTVAAALDAKVIAPNVKIFCENGAYTIGTHTITDGHPSGWLTLEGILQKSSNIGAAKIGETLGRARLSRYLDALGFGKRTGLRYPGETPGMLRDAATWSDVGVATISYGHGIAVSAVQLAAAYRALAADGVWRQPTLVKRIEGADGATLEAPAERRVYASATARAVGKLMESAVGDGTGWRAQIAGYRVAGKTGTANKIDPVAGGYSNDKTVAVFAGFVPADRPAVVIVVAVDEPQEAHQGGQVAAPAFAQIADASMLQLGVVPSGEIVSAALMRAGSRGIEEAPAPRAPAPARPAKAGSLPSFIGLTAREVLERAGELAASGTVIDVRMQGSGRVVRQEPASGTPPRITVVMQ
jgi:cell division protein FtsI (penicillin-binding protein 3)